MSNRYAQSPELGNYDNSHRALLQAFLSQSVMTFDEMKPVIAAILTAHGEQQKLYGLKRLLTFRFARA